MNIYLQYFDGCPNWKEVEAHLETLKAEGHELEISYEPVETPEAAIERGFRGSPTIVINGVDPFADPDAPVGLSCRVYKTESGYAGSPSLDQLREIISVAC